MKNLFSWQIMRQSFKSAWIWWAIIIGVSALNFFALPTMFESDADSSQLLNLFIDVGILGNGIIFATIFVVILGNALITSEIDRGTLAITLNTPTTRRQILFSKGLVLIGALVTIPLAIGAIGSISPILFGLDFDHAKWWTITGLWFMYTFLMGGIAFFIACWFNKSRYTLSATALILGAFFLLAMLSTINDFEFLRFFTLQTLFDIDAVLNGNSVIWQYIVMPIIAIPLYVAGVVKFLKKDLPI